MKAQTKIKSSIKLTKTENRVPVYVMPLVKFSIFAADAFLAAWCFMLAFVAREGDAIFAPNAWNFSEEFKPYAGVLLFVVFVRLTMLAYQRVYRLHGAFSYVNELIKIFKAVAVGSLLIVSFTFLFRGGFEFRDFPY